MKADRVEEILRREGLPVHRGRPVPLEMLPRLLVTRMLPITLRDGFVGYVLPSKVYGCVQSGRPLFYIGSAGSDVHLLGSTGSPRLLYPEYKQAILVEQPPGELDEEMGDRTLHKKLQHRPGRSDYMGIGRREEGCLDSLLGDWQ